MANCSMDLNCLEKHFVQMLIDALEKMIQVASNSSSVVVDPIDNPSAYLWIQTNISHDTVKYHWPAEDLDE